LKSKNDTQWITSDELDSEGTGSSVKDFETIFSRCGETALVLIKAETQKITLNLWYSHSRFLRSHYIRFYHVINYKYKTVKD
jgi:hypothetical protein